MQRLRPDDQFLLLLESDATPMQIGALLFLDVPDSQRASLVDTLQSHFAARLKYTPLLRVLRPCPLLYDSPVWLDVVHFDIAYHIVAVPGCNAMDADSLHEYVAVRSLERLDLQRPPFRIHIFDQLADGRSAMLIQVHHALTDGVGFQTILGLLSDGCTPAARPVGRNERAPPALLWLAASAWRFTRERGRRAREAERRRQTLAALKSYPRATTPVLKLSGPTSARRAYRTLSLDLPGLRAMTKHFGGTVNDMFLATASGALRRYLEEIDDLPATPLVANAARSYRRPEHGEFGNRIVALHPHLATNVANPVARLRAIQASMADEKRRTALDEAMLDQLETPFGPRNRARSFAARLGGRGAILPGNVTLSNVPGPATPRFIAGFRQISNYPTPLLGSGRFLNITSRRNGDVLDLGIMADPAQITDIDRLVCLLQVSFDEYAALIVEPVRPRAACA
jgi:diacylglycerol O-acyltransferase